MKNLLEFIVKAIVKNPDQVQIIQEENQEEEGVTLKIHVAAEDMGVVIGKSGHTIQAIRNLVRIKAIREGVRVRIEVEEPETEQMPENTPEKQQNEDVTV